MKKFTADQVDAYLASLAPTEISPQEYLRRLKLQLEGVLDAMLEAAEDKHPGITFAWKYIHERIEHYESRLGAA